jgi:hypothetical protein
MQFPGIKYKKVTESSEGLKGLLIKPQEATGLPLPCSKD